MENPSERAKFIKYMESSIETKDEKKIFRKFLKKCTRSLKDGTPIPIINFSIIYKESVSFVKAEFNENIPDILKEDLLQNINGWISNVLSLSEIE